jgi:translation initiation factor IF-2
MAKIRVYELAKQLNMTNKMLVARLKEMDVAVKSHMSVMDEEAVEGIKAGLFKTKSEGVVEKRIKGTIIRRRKKPALKEPEVEAVAPEQEPEEEAVPEAQPEQPEETAPPVEPAEAVEPVETEPAAEETKPEKKAKGKKKPKGKKEQPAKIIKVAEVKPVEEVPPQEAHEEPIPAEAKPSKRLKLVPPEKPAAKGKLKKKDKKRASEDEAKPFPKKKASFRKKAILNRADLYDDKAMSARKGKKHRRGKMAIKGEKPLITTPKAIKRRIKVDEAIMVPELAKRMGVKASEVIKQLMALGVIVTLNQAIDFETATVVANEFDYETERVSFEEGDVIPIEKDDPAKLKFRPPVVTIMGHVDHGKTSLLDAIRQTNVIAGEAGGITQHIGAYNVSLPQGQIVFLDTPGHEAFTAMRARGAEITDLVVLVVAADDGVMPQTAEAINHSRAANVPIMVAVNKIDKAEADPDRVKRQLAEQGLSPEEWGGDTLFVNVSAKQKQGIDELLEMILLQAEVMELQANPDKLAVGHVVEARLDPGRGSVATVLIQEGTLRAGDAVICGQHYGKIRAMVNDHGEPVDAATPSIPVEIHGLSGVPMAGDDLMAVSNEKIAKQVSFHRAQKQRVRQLAKSSRLTLEKYYEEIQSEPSKDLKLVIRGDVQGSVEALTEAILKIESTEVKVSVVHSATGAISESDIMLAKVSEAMVLGFNVRPNPKVRDLAAEQNVDIRFYEVIYNVISDIKAAMVGLMAPRYEERILGRAEVRQVFHVSKVGTIAGSLVTDGRLERGSPARVIRDDVVAFTGKIGSLRRFKDDVKEVLNGYECGIGIENFNDLKMKDVIECYEVDEIEPTID